MTANNDADLYATPGSGITRPHEDLCVTCKHHGTRWRSMPVGHEVHQAGFLTCAVRRWRSPVNGFESDWCQDIRADLQPCTLWVNDRDCQRCKWAALSEGFPRFECHHPSKERKFESGEFKGKSYWPDCRGHSWLADGPGPKIIGRDGKPELQMVYDEHVACGKDAPLWEDRGAGK